MVKQQRERKKKSKVNQILREKQESSLMIDEPSSNQNQSLSKYDTKRDCRDNQNDQEPCYNFISTIIPSDQIFNDDKPKGQLQNQINLGTHQPFIINQIIQQNHEAKLQSLQNWINYWDPYKETKKRKKYQKIDYDKKSKQEIKQLGQKYFIPNCAVIIQQFVCNHKKFIDLPKNVKQLIKQFKTKACIPKFDTLFKKQGLIREILLQLFSENKLWHKLNQSGIQNFRIKLEHKKLLRILINGFLNRELLSLSYTLNSNYQKIQIEQQLMNAEQQFGSQ